jgi:hypothetical protein
MAMSAMLADSECSTNSYVSPWIKKRILLNFGYRKTYEIPELLQLVLPQSEVRSPRYRILKVTRSAEFTVSDSSNASGIAPGTCTG